MRKLLQNIKQIEQIWEHKSQTATTSQAYYFLKNICNLLNRLIVIIYVYNYYVVVQSYLWFKFYFPLIKTQ